MCDCCGEHASEKTGAHAHPHGHDHGHDHGHGHDHEHGQAHAHDHGAKQAHDPARAAGVPSDLGGRTGRHTHSKGEATVSVDRVAGEILGANARTAERVRQAMTQRGILMLNITSGPGSGKTALLHATLRQLPEGSAAVLVGDLETDRDASRLHGLGAQVRQINTGKGCHLSAGQVAAGLDHLDLEGVKTVFIENVGNMACPSEYDLGEHARVTLLSLPEGDDKAAKYPGLFAAADVVLLNKVDLAHAIAFDETVLKDDLARLNTRAPLLRVSALGGQGLDAWLGWIEAQRARVFKVPAKA